MLIQSFLKTLPQSFHMSLLSCKTSLNITCIDVNQRKYGKSRLGGYSEGGQLKNSQELEDGSNLQST